jgi:hypothetical protein
MTKRVAFLGLLGLNLLLLSVLVLTAYRPPAAYAQGIGRAGEYVMVSAETQPYNDALYLLDIRNQLLHAIRTPFPRTLGRPTVATLVHTRDLARDFRR